MSKTGVDTTAPHPVDGNVLQTAQSLIYGQREEEYGDAFESFGNIAAGWSVILGVAVPPEAVALCMDWLKTCRLINTPSHRDSIVDKAGYAGCYEKIQDGRRRRDEKRCSKESIVASLDKMAASARMADGNA